MRLMSDIDSVVSEEKRESRRSIVNEWLGRRQYIYLRWLL